MEWTVWVFLLFFTQPSGIKAQECGVAPRNTRIVGGVDAIAGSWPWQVSMHHTAINAHICGGTIINTMWVLTAAHCIVTTNTSHYLLYFGKQTQNETSPNEVNRTVSKIVIHPEYNVGSVFNNDIALMELSSPINYTDYIRPVCLAANNSVFNNGTSCWGTGWGRLSRNEPMVAHNVLQEVQIPVIGSNQCDCLYGLFGRLANITAGMICAGELGKGICQGDSGGPVQCQQGNRFIQAGVASFGIPCAIGFPEVFARVSHFESWIINETAGTNVSFVEYTSNGPDADSSFECPVFPSTNTTSAPSNSTTTSAPSNSTTTSPSSRSVPSKLAFVGTAAMILLMLLFT